MYPSASHTRFEHSLGSRLSGLDLRLQTQGFSHQSYLHPEPIESNYLPEMWSGSEEGSYLRLIVVSLNSRLESNKEIIRKPFTLRWQVYPSATHTRFEHSLGVAHKAAMVSLPHPVHNIRANGASQKWTHPGMPPDSGGILRGCPLLGGAMCPHGVSRVVCQ